MKQNKIKKLSTELNDLYVDYMNLKSAFCRMLENVPGGYGVNAALEIGRLSHKKNVEFWRGVLVELPEYKGFHMTATHSTLLNETHIEIKEKMSDYEKSMIKDLYKEIK